MRFLSLDGTTPGVIAVGQSAVGFFAVGQEAVGVIAIGQIARGGIAVGQLSVGVVAVGQLAFGGFAVGQLALGLAAVGMLALGVGWAVALAGVAALSGGGLAFGLFGSLPLARIRVELRARLRRIPEDSPPREVLSRTRLIWAFVGTGLLAAIWCSGAAIALDSI